MPIRITNVTPHPTPRGLNHYRIDVNGITIAEFDHYPDLGMADCLSLAAEAVRKLPSPRAASDKE